MKRILVFFLAILSLSLPASAVTSGYVNSSAGTAISSASVNISNSTWNSVTTTNTSGYWAVSLTENGVYTYTVSKREYVTQNSSQTFNTGTTNYNFTLSCFGGLASCNPPPYNNNGYGIVNYDLYGSSFFLINFSGIVFSEGTTLKSANHSIGWTFSGAPITAPDNYTIVVPSAGTIKSIQIVSDVSTTTSFNVTKASFPTNGAVPTYTDITGGNSVNLTAAGSKYDNTLTGWTKTLAYHDILFVNVSSNNNANAITFQIDYS